MLFIQRTLTAVFLLVGFLFTTLASNGQTSASNSGDTNENPKIYEAIGMMFALGSGLGKMEFTEKQIDLILGDMKKGIIRTTRPYSQRFRRS